MKLRALSCALLIIAGVGPAAAASVTVFYPPDKAIVTTDKVAIEGIIKEGKPGQRLEIRVSGRTMKSLTSASGVRFADSLTLAPGVNAFAVVDLPDGKPVTVEVFYSDGKKVPPAGFYQPVKHPALDDGCDGCHAEENGAWVTTAKMPDGCFDCHDDPKKGTPASVHSPVGDGDCTACHAVHFAPVKKLLLKKSPELCWDCHDDVTLGEKKEPWKAPHAALDDGCSGCHRPHSSPAPKLLKQKGAALCTECHDDVAKTKDGAAWKQPHDPVGSGDCSACHRAHGSDTKKILASAVPALCNDCHDDVRLDDTKKDWSSPHSPVADGDCGACHAVHGSEQKALLKQKPPALCNDCHDDVTVDKGGAKAAVVHSPVGDGDCGGCHAIHGSASPKILKKASPALCFECHDDPNLDKNGQEWGTIHKPVRNGKCNDCHSAHAAPVKGLLLAPYNEICYKCHDAHSHPLQIMPVFKRKIELPKDMKATKKNELPCGYCHKVHGSDESYMLAKDRQNLCIRCHKF